MRSVETDAATIDEAIERALELLQVDRDRVEVEILENASRGVLGFGGKSARVRATIRSPLTVDDPSGDTGPDVSQETKGPNALDVVAPAVAFLERILNELGIDASVEVGAAHDGVVNLLVRGEDTGIVIGRHGQTLDAIEYLLNRMGNQRGPGSIRIAVDVEGYRERRQESLEQTARRLAAQAKQSGKSATLSPMSPRDRRIVHLALSGDQDVTTRSEGEGSYRRVVIVPTRPAGRARPGA